MLLYAYLHLLLSVVRYEDVLLQDRHTKRNLPGDGCSVKTTHLNTTSPENVDDYD